MTVSDSLRDELGRIPETIQEFAQKHDVDVGELSRFLRGQPILAIETVDKITSALGLKLVKKSDSSA